MQVMVKLNFYKSGQSARSVLYIALTSIFPVTTSEIRAVRYSCKRAISFSILDAAPSILVDWDSMN